MEGFLFLTFFIILWVLISKAISNHSESKIKSIGGGFISACIVFTLSVSLFAFLSMHNAGFDNIDDYKVARESGFTNATEYYSYIRQQELKKVQTEKVERLKKIEERKQLSREREKAIFIVESHPSSTGHTIGQYLDKKASIPAIVDAGWSSSRKVDGYIVERNLYLDNLHLIYRWKVKDSGGITPLNGKALAITP